MNNNQTTRDEIAKQVLMPTEQAQEMANTTLRSMAVAAIIRWVSAALAVAAAALSAYEFSMYATVAGAYDWSLRWLAFTVAATVVGVWPGIVTAAWAFANSKRHLVIRPATKGDVERRNINLDILRLFLAIEVVADHCWRLTSDPLLPLAQPISAVATFLCLSGFLIPASLNRSRGYADFAWKRILRVAPAFCLSLLLVYALFGPRAASQSFLWYLTAGLVASATLNAPMWSLMVEEVMYAWHAASRRLTAKLNPDTYLVLWLVFAVTAFEVDALKHFPAGKGHLFISYHLSVIGAFFIGNWFYHRRDLIATFRWQPVALLLAGTIVMTQTVGIGLWSTITCPLAVLTAIRLPQPKIRWVDISYGVYVYHYPLMIWIARHAGGYAHLLPKVLATAFVVAALSWFAVESQALRMKSRRAVDCKTPAAVGASAGI